MVGGAPKFGVGESVGGGRHSTRMNQNKLPKLIVNYQALISLSQHFRVVIKTAQSRKQRTTFDAGCVVIIFQAV